MCALGVVCMKILPLSHLQLVTLEITIELYTLHCEHSITTVLLQ